MLASILPTCDIKQDEVATTVFRLFSGNRLDGLPAVFRLSRFWRTSQSECNVLCWQYQDVIIFCPLTNESFCNGVLNTASSFHCLVPSFFYVPIASATYVRPDLHTAMLEKTLGGPCRLPGNSWILLFNFSMLWLRRGQVVVFVVVIVVVR